MAFSLKLNNKLIKPAKLQQALCQRRKPEKLSVLKCKFFSWDDIFSAE
jgi:hypothetical protein